jgi:tetratricopeptide (TPR) repeat protein
MNEQTATNLLMVSPLTRYGGFYQELLKGFSGCEALGNQLTRRAEVAHAFRQFQKVRELALILSNIPLKGYKAISTYFLAVAANNKGAGDQDEAGRLFELAIDTAPDAYKVKSILSLGALSFHKRDFDSALYFYQEAIKGGPLSGPCMQAIKGISTIKAIEGDHRHAVNDLERVLPIIKYAPSHTYFDLLNSYAVELGEVGRKDEARNIIRHVVASPFALAYPEWQETAQELKEPDRSFISVPHVEHKPLEIEVRETSRARREDEARLPARVVPFPELKQAPKKREPANLGEFANMTPPDKREFILAAVRREMLPESEYDNMMLMLGLVKGGPADPVIDLEDEIVLNDLMVEWAHLVEPEELAGVISAFRDCEDDFRRNSILDRMISKVFECSRACNITEPEWRLQVERRLPER